MIRQTNLPIKIYRNRFDSQSSSIGATVIPSTLTPRLYRVSFAVDSSGGTINGSTVQITIKFGYNAVIHSLTGSVMALDGTIGENLNFLFWHDGSGGQPSITFETNYVAGAGDRGYFLAIYGERISSG